MAFGPNSRSVISVLLGLSQVEHLQISHSLPGTIPRGGRDPLPSTVKFRTLAPQAALIVYICVCVHGKIEEAVLRMGWVEGFV